MKHNITWGMKSLVHVCDQPWSVTWQKEEEAELVKREAQLATVMLPRASITPTLLKGHLQANKEALGCSTPGSRREARPLLVSSGCRPQGLHTRVG